MAKKNDSLVGTKEPHEAIVVAVEAFTSNTKEQKVNVAESLADMVAWLSAYTYAQGVDFRAVLQRASQKFTPEMVNTCLSIKDNKPNIVLP